MIHLDELRHKFDNSPYALHLGMQIVELSRGYAKVKLELKRDFLTWDNLVQGGVIASLIDQAFGYSLNTLDNIYVAVQLNINFLSSPAVGDTIYAESKVLHAGRSLGVCEMTVVDSRGKAIARATGTTISKGPRK
ncbi:MAG: PaaI family thioesterase [Chloroflexota bacterium]